MRVVVADDAMLIREGLARLLRDAGVEVVGKAGDADELLRRVAARPARTSRSSTSACRRRTPTRDWSPPSAIRDEHPDVGVLVLSQYLEPRYALRLLEEHRSASATCSRSASPTSRVLVDALRRVAEGECVIDPTIVAQLVGAPRADGPLDELTDARARGARPDGRGPLEPRRSPSGCRSARRRSRATCTRSS